MDTTVYNFETVVAAIDFLFKYIHTLNLPYPETCPHVWSFFQDYVYDMKDLTKKGIRTKSMKEFNLSVANAKNGDANCNPSSRTV